MHTLLVIMINLKGQVFAQFASIAAMATAGRRKRQQTSLRSLTSDEWKKFRDTYESYRILWDESLKSYNDESAKECLYNLFALKMKDSGI